MKAFFVQVEEAAELIPHLGRLLADIADQDRAAIRRLRVQLHLDREILDGLVAWGAELGPSIGGDRRQRVIRPRTAIRAPEGESLTDATEPSIYRDIAVHNPGHSRGPRPCHLCGREYLDGRADSRYCSDRCRRLAYRRDQGEDITAQLRMLLDPPGCSACGELLTGRRVGTRYCDDACRKRAQRERSQS
jgi:hypothetical protein